MPVNKLYDAVVIGYNDDTRYLLKNCAISKTDKLYAVISKTIFDCDEKIDKYLGEVIYLKYDHGIIHVFNDGAPSLVCKKLILSVGTRHKTLNFGNKSYYSENIYYNIDFRNTNIKVIDKRVIVVGDSDDVIKNSLTIAKLAKEVYVCSSDPTSLNRYNKLTSRLKNKPDNIHMLINSEITDIAGKTDGSYQVSFNTYNKIDCDLVIGYLGRIPDTQPFLKEYATVGADQKIIVTDTGQTGPLPNVYAIGECTDYKDETQKNNNIIKVAKVLKGE